MPNMTLRFRLGPLVEISVDGANCKEIAQALEGYEELNTRVDAMCSDLAERVYPEGDDQEGPRQEETTS